MPEREQRYDNYLFVLYLLSKNEKKDLEEIRVTE